MTPTWQIFPGDCVEVMQIIPDASIDAVVTDPPYGIGFMGHEWDQPGDAAARRRGMSQSDLNRTGHDHKLSRVRGGSMVAGEYDQSAAAHRQFQAWCEVWAAETLRVLKPGGHILVFGGTRTFHRLTSGLEDAGFEIRDCLTWLYGSGFPKSRNLDGDWEGWGTALKPGWEPIVMGRKPLGGTVAATVAEHGTGALHIDACRIPSTDSQLAEKYASVQAAGARSNTIYGTDARDRAGAKPHEGGRWPANAVLDEDTAAELDAQTGKSRSRSGKPRAGVNGSGWGMTKTGAEYDDEGGASRFFYCAKASRTERDIGFDERGGNDHPTVKPIALMQWCIRLITPPGGAVLDPFMGSGSTGLAAIREGVDFIGIERKESYAEIARVRLLGEAAQGELAA